MIGGQLWASWRRWLVPMVLGGSLVVLLATQAGCGERWRRWKERNRDEPDPKPRQVMPQQVRDVPAPMRGMLNAQARLRGTVPTRASGIGFVVGLDGTGGQPLPEAIAAHLEREMALLGVGKSGAYRGTALEGKNPRELLADANTAAVIVEAALPPGARKGARFDIYVRAINASSLQGGRLWTTELRPGPPSAFGNKRARVVGEASGPIYINPFADPDNRAAGVIQTVGRVLNGGAMTEDLQIEVILDNPSHARARQVTSMINSAMPGGRGDRGPTARGHDESLVSVQVPHRYADRRGQFTSLLRHLTVDPTLFEVYARRYAMTLKSQPYLADEMAWGLESLGERALPFVRDLYDFGEAAPRLRALRTGAHLNDPMAVSHLTELAEGGPDNLRPDAVRLLSQIDGGPKVDTTLRRLMNEDTLTLRVAAYEGLVERGVLQQRRRLENMQRSIKDRVRLNRVTLESLSRLRLPPGTLQGVTRELVAGSFLLDEVPGGDGLIYVTQQGEPRIAIFGDDVRLQTPLLLSMWSDRLMLVAERPGEPVRLFYADDQMGKRVIQDDTPMELGAFVRFLAHKPSPEDPRPGLALTYPEVVGVLYELSRQGGVRAAFSTERDRLLAELLAAGESDQVELRPESPDDASEIVVFGFDDPTRSPTPPRPTRDSLLVPIGPRAGEPDATEPDASEPPAAPEADMRPE